MGFLKPRVEGRPVKSQATPLAEGILEFLVNSLSGEGGAEGGGDFGAAQRGLGEFAEARSSPEQFLELMGPLRAMFDRETERNVAQTKEDFSVTGNRLGTGLAREAGRVRTERSTDLDALMSQLFLQEQDKLLTALTSLRDPFVQFGSQGIQPDKTIVSDAPFVAITKTLADLAKGAGALIGGVKA